MKRLVVMALVMGFGGAAYARAPEKKGPAASAAEKAKLDAKLRAQIGKKPAPILSLWNVHTHEAIAIDADPKKVDLPEETADEYFRCYFTNHPTNWDRRLLKVLAQAAANFKQTKIIIVSGYRARKYNLMLRKKGHEVARESQHSEGHAVDFALPGVETKALREYVKSLRVGGVGFYPQSGFVHADTGRIRFWTGR